MSFPLRMCVVCRQMKQKNELLRIVKNKDGILSIDTSGKSAGRGAYICRSSSCRDNLIKTRAVERAFHCSISQELKENIMKELI